MVIEGLTTDWACQSWFSSNSGFASSGDLLQTFGHVPVPVAHCETQQFNDQLRSTMLLKDFIESSQTSGATALYLKDWHMVRDAPAGYQAYRQPLFFSDDWINAYWDSHQEKEQDDYIGRKGTFTPLHKDVFRSYSWSANVVGCKRW